MLTAVLLGVTLTGACGNEGDAIAARTSDERPAGDSAPGDIDGGGEELPPAGELREYCDRAAALQTSQGSFAEDPAAQLEAIESLASVAPPELEEDFDVMSEVIDQLSDLDEDDPESLGRIFEIAFDPEVQTAARAIVEFTERECGLDLGVTESSGGSIGSGDVSSGSGGTASDLELEDIDGVKDASVGGAWSDKLTGTLISGGAEVQLSADSSEPLTPAEAVVACTTMWQVLSIKNPAVTIKILNGERAVAASGADGACRPRP